MQLRNSLGMWERSKGPGQSARLTFRLFWRFLPLKFVKFDMQQVNMGDMFPPHCEWKQWCLHTKELMKPGRNLSVTDKYQGRSSESVFRSIPLSFSLMKDTSVNSLKMCLS